MLRTRIHLGALCLILGGGLLPASGIDIAVVEAGEDAHARQVGLTLYAGDRGAIRTLSPYRSTDWLTDGFLHAGDPTQEPEIEFHDIQNHSWVGQSGRDGSLSLAVDALRRLDYAIVRDGFTAVVSLENSRSSEVPELLGHGYNVITVGRMDGEHSRGGTWLDGIGRSKPDLVGVMPATSLNVPAVSAAAAYLMSVAESEDGLFSARRPEAIKAILMASANKSVLPNWEPDSGEMLDPVYGAGVLDASAALGVLRAGPQVEALAPRGWQVDWTRDTPSRYTFSVPSQTRVDDLSVALVWNREVRDTDPGPGFRAEADLPDLNLGLYRELKGGILHPVELSEGTVNNVECLFLTRLPPGRYTLEVTGRADTPFALAWNGSAVPGDR